LGTLLNPDDQFAFNTAIQLLLKDPALLKSYSVLLEQQCQRVIDAASNGIYVAFQRLELKDLHLSCGLPTCIASLLGAVDFYDLSGNEFEGVREYLLQGRWKLCSTTARTLVRLRKWTSLFMMMRPLSKVCLQLIVVCLCSILCFFFRCEDFASALRAVAETHA
jgi:hypothetical protein